MVDPGSSGAGTFERLKEIIDASNTRTLAFIDVSYTGMDEGEQDPSHFKVRPMVEIAKAFPDDIVGYKTATTGRDNPTTVYTLLGPRLTP